MTEEEISESTVCYSHLCDCYPRKLRGGIRSFSVLPMLRFTHPIGLLSNSLPQIKKLLGGCATAAICSSNLPFSCQFTEVFEPFWCSKTFFSSILRIKTWRAIIMILYFTHKLTKKLKKNCTRGWFWLFKAKKHQNLGNWRMITQS